MSQSLGTPISMTERFIGGTAYLLTLVGFVMGLFQALYLDGVKLSLLWYALPTVLLLTLFWSRPFAREHLKQAILLQVVGAVTGGLPYLLRYLLGPEWYKVAKLKRIMDEGRTIGERSLGITPAWALLALVMIVVGIYVFVSLTEGMVRGYGGQSFTVPWVGRLVARRHPQ